MLFCERKVEIYVMLNARSNRIGRVRSSLYRLLSFWIQYPLFGTKSNVLDFFRGVRSELESANRGCELLKSYGHRLMTRELNERFLKRPMNHSRRTPLSFSLVYPFQPYTPSIHHHERSKANDMCHHLRWKDRLDWRFDGQTYH